MSARVLVIEDDPALRELMTAILTSAGHQVIRATDGREGTALLARQTIDLVITDVLMPNQDGLETIMSIRRTHPNLPVIAITGGNRIDPAHYLRMARALGATRVLEKPFGVAEFARTVNELLLRLGCS